MQQQKMGHAWCRAADPNQRLAVRVVRELLSKTSAERFASVVRGRHLTHDLLRESELRVELGTAFTEAGADPGPFRLALQSVCDMEGLGVRVYYYGLSNGEPLYCFA